MTNIKVEYVHMYHSFFSRTSSTFSYYTAPDGGWGWVIVAASFLVNMIADGVTFSFGVLFVEFQVGISIKVLFVQFQVGISMKVLFVQFLVSRISAISKIWSKVPPDQCFSTFFIQRNSSNL